MGTNRLLKVLLVENNKNDRIAASEFLYQTGKVLRIQSLTSLEAAWIYFSEIGKYPNFKMPDFIIISSTLLLSNSRARFYLQEFKSDKRLSDTIIIILTEFSNEEKILRLKDLSSDCFLTKPLNTEQLNKIFLSLDISEKTES